MLQMNEITIKYGDNLLFEKQSFQIKNNCLTTIVGESGCGKTSLLYCLGLINHQDCSNYYIDGIDVSKLNEKDRALIKRSKLGFMFQEYMLYDHLNIYDNLKLYATINNQSLDENQAQELLKQVYLNLDITRQLYTLSGGQKQRLALACILAKNPDIIILDEPTSALDHHNRTILFKILTRLKKDKTIIITSHNQEALDYSDEIIEIKNQKITKIKEAAIDIDNQAMLNQSKLSFDFYYNYVKKFRNKTKKNSLLLILVLLSSLLVNLFIYNYGTSYVNKNKELLMENSSGQIFIRTNEKIEDGIPYYDINFKIGGMSYPVIPYFDNEDIDDKMWTRFYYGSNQGLLLSYDLYQELCEVIVPTDTITLHLQTGNQELDVTACYLGILQEGIGNGYDPINTKYLYLHQQIIEDLIKDKSADGYTLFGNTYENTIKITKEAKAKGYEVYNDFGSFSQIESMVKMTTYIQISAILVTMIITIILINSLYSSYVSKRQKEFALLKSIGLNFNEVSKIIMLEIGQLMTVALIMTFIFITIFKLINDFNYLLSLLLLLINVIFLFLMITIVVIKKIKKLNPVQVFRN